jgi:hypothetical protein
MEVQKCRIMGEAYISNEVKDINKQKEMCKEPVDKME